ncbi:hypothetical protein POTG_02231 [Paenibacillus sp. oral taxon 786 str. D14]|uniref:hypothetical protein n=1 Tax=Paenibacillus sp. oral taxon 786 TaxID=652715 RepID=UPI0001AFD9D8|nr:hypothetical protein [Paenibacillus sp. oral taxon 786]EES73131.1 hypothetical protein POTG_02231 [Paenibacillus sp. oral taxon 786 str. D14]
MIANAQTCNESLVSSRRSLLGFELDDAQTAMLLSIARRHCKLVLEHGKAGTLPERRREIVKEIRSLRSARDALIEQL